jgi:hypothetical protein
MRLFFTKILTIMLLALFSLHFATGQTSGDTTVVQTFTFADICKRQGTWQFPSTNKKWGKVLMYYTLKCDAATIWDQYPCGEWDYLTYTVLHDSTGIMDSTLKKYPNFSLLGVANTDTNDLVYTPNPTYTQYNNWQKWLIVDNTLSETSLATAAGTQTLTNLMQAAQNRGKTQFLWTQAELTALGLTAGDISAMALDLSMLGSDLNNLNISIKESPLTALAKIEVGGFTKVYEKNTSFSNTGLNRFDFLAPFTWSGNSGILIEISFDAPNGTMDFNAMGETTTNAASISTTAKDGYLQLDRDWIEVPNANNLFATVDSQVTISYWTYGDASLPRNTSMFEAYNGLNHRTLNAHHPWSDGNVYWDAGDAECPSGYDRINKAVPVTDMKGSWVHWAFTKNTKTGYMRIFKNGALFHSGTGKYKSMKDIQRFVIGTNLWGDPNVYYVGKLNDFAIFDKELSQAEIQAYMYKDIDAAHPQYAHLLAYYPMDNDSATVLHDAGPGHYDGGILGMPEYKEMKGKELYRNATAENARPNATFFAGSYATHLDSALVTENVQNPAISSVIYDANSHTVGIDTILVWKAGYSYVYTDGVKTDSVWNTATDTLDRVFYSYYDHFEKVNNIEIGRFITPYGIGLDLGADGFTWLYDITDYSNMLHDKVTISAGNTQELLDLKFVCIEGTPPRDIVRVDKVHDIESHSYGNLAANNTLKADTVAVDPSASNFKMITRFTGHGHEGIYNASAGLIHCCEWADKQHNMTFNGAASPQINWNLLVGDMCSTNPVGAQGGNWASTRDGGWCPAAPVPDHEFDVTQYVQNNQLAVDYGIEAVPANNTGQASGNYIVSMHLVEYKNPNFTLDAAVDQILSPNNWDYLRGTNPICNKPSVRIKNTGITPITSLEIRYGVEGGITKIHQWTGNMAFLESKEVVLPFTWTDWTTTSSTHKFWVEVVKPNNGVDEYAKNNKMYSQFELPPVYPNQMKLRLKNNAIPNDISLVIRDVTGNVIFIRDNMPVNYTFNDALTFQPGCYQMEITAYNELGLKYPLAPDVGNGFLQFRDQANTQILKVFPSDFGKRIIHNFTIAYGLPTEQGTDIPKGVQVYPNPTKGMFTLDATADFNGVVKVEVTDIVGKVIYHSEQEFIGTDYSQDINLSEMANGVYLVRVSNGVQSYTQKLVKE